MKINSSYSGNTLASITTLGLALRLRKRTIRKMKSGWYLNRLFENRQQNYALARIAEEGAK